MLNGRFVNFQDFLLMNAWGLLYIPAIIYFSFVIKKNGYLLHPIIDKIFALLIILVNLVKFELLDNNIYFKPGVFETLNKLIVVVYLASILIVYSKRLRLVTCLFIFVLLIGFVCNTSAVLANNFLMVDKTADNLPKTQLYFLADGFPFFDQNISIGDVLTFSSIHFFLLLQFLSYLKEKIWKKATPS